MTRFEEEEHHGWSPDVGSGGSDRATEANQKAFDGPPEGRQPGATESQEEREGVPPTDTEARSPLNVGTSDTKSAEEYGAEGEEGRRTLGTKGESERPYGDTEDSGGVGSSEPIDPDSPHLPPA